MTGERPIGLAPGAPVEATGQDARKYAATNPVVRHLISRWLGVLADAVGPEPGTVIDVGVGEGLALERLAAVRGAVGVELRLGKLAAARERLAELRPVCADAGMLPFPAGAADTVTCIELLEHLPTPRPAVAELARISRHRCVVSVPWEPWFRLGNLGRGKNLRRWGNDPEHVQWFTPASLRALLLEGFADVEVRPCLPWLVATARHARRR
ncbi:MAG: class I SAM-dependent methyltransferase [Actinobacteria bacterium]|nr:class I SAM-dependent methyltransferase [Actinomycetota bacterium]